MESEVRVKLGQGEGKDQNLGQNRTGKSPEFTKGSNLGHEKQSVDLRYSQAGPGGRKAESTLVW